MVQNKLHFFGVYLAAQSHCRHTHAAQLACEVALLGTIKNQLARVDSDRNEVARIVITAHESVGSSFAYSAYLVRYYPIIHHSIKWTSISIIILMSINRMQQE